LSTTPTCDMNCKQCVVLGLIEKTTQKTPVVGCCLSCRHHRDPYRKRSKGDFINLEDQIKAYGSFDAYNAFQSDLVVFWCNRDFDRAKAESTREHPVAVHPREFKINQPCYPDDRPCPNWICGYGYCTINPKDVFQLW
jgi:hypothetical protein